MTRATIGAPENPFSTRRHRAGALAYRFEETSTIAAHFEHFLALGAEAELRGPEGTGKSTLLAATAREAARRGWTVHRATIAVGGPAPTIAPATQNEGRALLCLDEADRLSWWQFRRLRRACRTGGVALLCATHRPLGLPLLRATQVSPALAIAIAAEVLARSPALPRLVRADEAGSLLASRGGNLREVLLALYDRYEALHAAPPGVHRGVVDG